MKRGVILKLSKEGLDWLARDDKGQRIKLATLRFEYRCLSRKISECITVRKSGTKQSEQYHRSFLEPA